ncbi:ATP-binding cassette domain-containing protein [Paenibacillus sp. FA6]|uniref:ATP-binding cassette domain-containing protein n=1 Tax=Paenibacillus sp. FA6 TaxID=3413029 RepID=UPI003F65FCC1
MKTNVFLWRLIKYRPGLYLLNIIFWTGIYISPIFVGLYTRDFFNILSNEEGTNGSLVIALFASVILGRIVFIFFGVIIDTSHGFMVANLVRRNLLDMILHLPGSQGLKGSTGEVINHLRDDVEQVVGAISWIVDTIGMVLFAIIAFIVLFRIDSQITLFVFIPLIIVFSVVHITSAKVQAYRRESRESSSKVSGAIGEIFSIIQSIKLGNADSRFIERFDALAANQKKSMLKDNLFTSILDTVFMNTINIGTGLILLMLAFSTQSNTFSIGDLALFVFYLSFITQFIQFFGKFLASYKQTEVAMERMTSLVQGQLLDKVVEHHSLYINEIAPLAIDDIYKDTEPLRILQIKDLSFTYGSSSRGIQIKSLDIKVGSFVVIAGRIGSGKTTLMKTIQGLLPKDSGDILWNGRVVNDLCSFFIPPRSGYTSQIPQLYNETLRNNILLGLSEDDVDLNEALYDAVLNEDIKSLELGLDTMIGSGGSKLSGGQKIRAASARMLVRKPEILFMDDISSALDVETETLLWKRITQKKNVTSIVVSNKMAALQYADHVVVLKDGCIESQGPLQEMMESSSELQALLSGSNQGGGNMS